MLLLGERILAWQVMDEFEKETHKFNLYHAVFKPLLIKG